MLHDFLDRVLSHPLTRGLSTDDPRTTILRRRIVQEKVFLRKLYNEWYDRLLAAIPAEKDVPGKVLEIGSGGGFFKRKFPECIASDILVLPGLDCVLDAQHLPFSASSLRCIAMIDALHHIPDPGLFFDEAQRALHEGGAIIMLEPWNSAFGRWVYQHLHPEPFIPDAKDWTLGSLNGLPKNGPLSAANGAIPYICFVRDRERFERLFPSLEIVSIEPCYPFSYLLSGGVSMRALAPGWTFGLFRSIENLLRPWARHLGMFAVITLKKL